MNIAIETPDSITPVVRSRGKKAKYPFAKLGIGQAFFIPFSCGVKRLRSSLASRRCYYEKKLAPHEFALIESTKVIDGEEELGIWVKRVADKA